MTSAGTVLRKRLAEFLARILDLMKAKMTPTVVVLTPPPVDPGDAPINMRTMRRSAEFAPKAARSMVLKPAVLAVTV